MRHQSPRADVRPAVRVLPHIRRMVRRSSAPRARSTIPDVVGLLSGRSHGGRSVGRSPSATTKRRATVGGCLSSHSHYSGTASYMPSTDAATADSCVRAVRISRPGALCQFDLLIAKGRRPAVVARLLQVNRTGLYRRPKRPPKTADRRPHLRFQRAPLTSSGGRCTTCLQVEARGRLFRSGGRHSSPAGS
jgi:hypothetical protein